MKPVSAGDRRRFWIMLGSLILLPLVAISTYYVVTLRSKAASCYTVDQVKNDTRCLYIYKTGVYEKGTRSQPHQGNPCGSDVTAIIPDSHLLDKIGHLDPNYQGDLCTASEPVPTSAPAPTNTPAPTATPRPTSTPAPTSTPRPTTASSTSSTLPTQAVQSTSTTATLPTQIPVSTTSQTTQVTPASVAAQSGGVQTIPAAQKTPEVTALPVAGAGTSSQFYVGSVLLLMAGAIGVLVL